MEGSAGYVAVIAGALGTSRISCTFGLAARSGCRCALRSRCRSARSRQAHPGQPGPSCGVTDGECPPDGDGGAWAPNAESGGRSPAASWRPTHPQIIRSVVAKIADEPWTCAQHPCRMAGRS